MGVDSVRKQIGIMMRYEDDPQFLLIQFGGNDIGKYKVGILRNKLKNEREWLQKKLPNTVVIWSQVLSRCSWRYSPNKLAMEKCRLRINSSVASFVLKRGGCYIRYPDIKPTQSSMLPDGVHLTDVGNNIYLNTLAGALETFSENRDVIKGGITYPL